MLRRECSVWSNGDEFVFGGTSASLRASSNTHRLRPSIVALPSSIGTHVTVWQVPHPESYPCSGPVDALTKHDWAEIGALRNSGKRRRALGMRIFLREALSAAVDGVAPCEWRFGRTVYGKPHIRNSSHHVDFNISHIHDASFLAISRTARVGIDAAAQVTDGWQAIAAEFFTREERAMLNGSPADHREQEFLRLWTAKEAFAKLIGVGLALDAPANDCATGTLLATCTGNTPQGRVVISIAVDPVVDSSAHPVGRPS